MLKIVKVFLAAFLLAGCNTMGLNTPEAMTAKEVVAKGCTISRDRSGGTGGNASTQRGVGNDVAVFSIEQGQGGWERYDAATEGIRGMIYHNKRDGKVICGGQNWDSLGLTFQKI